jgi:hypothetical protein
MISAIGPPYRKRGTRSNVRSQPAARRRRKLGSTAVILGLYPLPCLSARLATCAGRGAMHRPCRDNPPMDAIRASCGLKRNPAQAEQLLLATREDEPHTAGAALQRLVCHIHAFAHFQLGILAKSSIATNVRDVFVT